MSFPFAFACFTAADVEVYEDGIQKTTGFTVTLNTPPDAGAVSNGGEVTYVTAPAAGVKLAIVRAVAYTQGIAYPTGADKFPAISHQNGLDRLTILTQQNLERLGRALTFGVASLFKDVAFPDLEAGKFLRATLDGLGLEWLDSAVDTGTFVQSGAGAVSRGLDTKLAEIGPSVLDFIPVVEHAAIKAGTSTYDAAVDIQKAIDTDEAVIHYPAGRYVIGAHLRPKSYQRHLGQGRGRTIIDRALNPTAGRVFHLGPDSIQVGSYGMGKGTFFRINAAAEGATFVTATTAADAGTLTPGEWVYLRANKNEGDLPGDVPEPKNFEYAVVKAVNAGTGQIDLEWPLVRGYTTADVGYEPELMRAVTSGVIFDVTIADMTLRGGTAGTVDGACVHLLLDGLEFDGATTAGQFREVFNLRVRDCIGTPSLEGGFGIGAGAHHVKFRDVLFLGLQGEALNLQEEAYHVDLDGLTVLGASDALASPLFLNTKPQNVSVRHGFFHGGSVALLELSGRRLLFFGNHLQHAPAGFEFGDPVQDAIVLGNFIRKISSPTVQGRALRPAGTGFTMLANHVGDVDAYETEDMIRLDAASSRVIASANHARRVVTDLSASSEAAPAAVWQFYLDNVPANATTQMLNLAGRTTGYLAARAGSVIGLAVSLSAARTAGTLTVKVAVSSNGGSTWASLAASTWLVLDGTTPQFLQRRFSRHSVDQPNAFAAGDLLRVEIFTDAAWAPITADAQVAVEIESGLPAAA